MASDKRKEEKMKRRSPATILMLCLVSFFVFGLVVSPASRGSGIVEITYEEPEATQEPVMNYASVHTQEGAEQGESYIGEEDFGIEDTDFDSEEKDLGVVDIASTTYSQNTGKTYLGRFYVTGYDICYECCGKIDGITASGTYATVGRTIAAPSGIPFGTTLYIDGIGERVVEDRGGLVTGNRLDVLCVNHDVCYAITGWYDVYVVGEDAV